MNAISINLPNHQLITSIITEKLWQPLHKIFIRCIEFLKRIVFYSQKAIVNFFNRKFLFIDLTIANFLPKKIQKPFLKVTNFVKSCFFYIQLSWADSKVQFLEETLTHKNRLLHHLENQYELSAQQCLSVTQEAGKTFEKLVYLRTEHAALVVNLTALKETVRDVNERLGLKDQLIDQKNKRIEALENLVSLNSRALLLTASEKGILREKKELPGDVKRGVRQLLKETELLKQRHDHIHDALRVVHAKMEESFVLGSEYVFESLSIMKMQMTLYQEIVNLVCDFFVLNTDEQKIVINKTGPSLLDAITHLETILLE